MERDALLAHGTSFLLQDRLMNCSDYSTAWVCRTCGSMASLGYDDVGIAKQIGYGSASARLGGPDGTQYYAEDLATGPGGEYCRVCRAEAEKGEKEKKIGASMRFESMAQEMNSHNQGADMDVVAVPFVFRLLVAELASMAIQITAAVC